LNREGGAVGPPRGRLGLISEKLDIVRVAATMSDFPPRIRVRPTPKETGSKDGEI